MEPSNIGFGILTKGIWQWKSNRDAYDNSEKSVWESYSFLHNEMIEEAYHQNKDVKIGNYIVSPKRLLQIKKTNPQAQRPIRRIGWMEDGIVHERAERYYETELPKTINNIFGDLKEFLRFFANRSPEMLNFAKEFEEIEKYNDFNELNQRVIPAICTCIEKEFKKASSIKQTESSVISSLKTIQFEATLSHEEKTHVIHQIIYFKMKEKCKMLTELFTKEDFQSFEDFYSCILKAYTMGTFLYRNLNSYLRNEEWIELNPLLPYLYCLCKAFFSINFKLQTETNPSRNDILQTVASNGKKFLTLYRGARLDESALSFYDTKKVRYFSWNAVTSATSNLKIARRFINQIDNSEFQTNPVLFVINIPFEEKEVAYMRYLDVKSCSAVPHEDEVILPPGSTFELQEFLKGPNDLFNDDKIITITVELQSDFRRLYCRGEFVSGSMLNEIISNKVVCIKKFSSTRLLEILKVLSGNLLIEELKFEDCCFDDESLKQLTKILPTTTKLKRLKFGSKSFLNVKEIEHKKEPQMKAINKSRSCKSQEEAHLGIDFVMLSNENITALRKWTLIKNLSHLKSLSLDFFQDDLFGNFQIYELCTSGLRYLIHLNSLQLDLSACYKITERGIYYLCFEGIQYLNHLNYLQLNFSKCSEITNDAIDHIEKSFKYIIHLTDLDLDFSQCLRISEERIYALCSQGLLHLPALSSVTLVFWRYSLQTLDELESLFSQRLKYFSLSRCVEDPEEDVKTLKVDEKELEYSAKKRSLNIDSRKSITDREMSALDHPPIFTSLALNFSKENQRTNIGISNFCNQICPNLTGHIFLNLNFSDCKMIRNGEISSLCTYALSSLTRLKPLDSSFSRFREITDEGTQCFRELNNLIALTSLNLNFSQGPSLTDRGIHTFCVKGLRYLDHLIKLDLNFSGCSQINDEGVHFLCVDGLNQLIKLKDLSLNFAECSEITNAGIRSLVQFGLANISDLIHISINFSRCFNITDDAFHDLYTQRLSHLKASTTLNLYLWWDIHLQLRELDDFFEPNTKDLAHSVDQQSSQDIKITPKHELKFLAYLIYQNFHLLKCNYRPKDENQNNLMKGANHLTVLTSIALDFSPYRKIAEAGSINLFMKGICLLTSLTNISLNFGGCEYISDEKVETLCVQFLSRLSALTCLSLKLSGCKQITNKRVLSLCSQGLKHIVTLTTFNLDLSSCHNITDEVIQTLALDGLKHLTALTSLDLNFSYCNGITDKGIQTLALDGLKYLTALTSLNLNFSSAKCITDEGIQTLALDGLKHLIALTSLNLDFSDYPGITDEGIQTLALYGLKHLTALTSLNLKFSYCKDITDEGILNFCFQGLKNLTALRTFCLDFSLWNQKNFDSQCAQAINNLPHLPPLTIFWDQDHRTIATKRL